MRTRHTVSMGMHHSSPQATLEAPCTSRAVDHQALTAALITPFTMGATVANVISMGRMAAVCTSHRSPTQVSPSMGRHGCKAPTAQHRLLMHISVVGSSKAVAGVEALNILECHGLLNLNGQETFSDVSWCCQTLQCMHGRVQGRPGQKSKLHCMLSNARAFGRPDLMSSCCTSRHTERSCLIWCPVLTYHQVPLVT